MHKDTITLLMYLENQFVIQEGFINGDRFSDQDWQSIGHWQDQGLLTIEETPPPQKAEGKQPTHKVKLSEKLFDLATSARKAHAQRLNDMKKGDGTRKSPLKLVQNGQLQAAPNMKELGAPSKSKIIDYNHFIDWLEAHNKGLNGGQEPMAKLMFTVFNDPACRTMVQRKGAGQSWLFKTIDQYLTALKNGAFKNNNK